MVEVPIHLVVVTHPGAAVALLIGGQDGEQPGGADAVDDREGVRIDHQVVPHLEDLVHAAAGATGEQSFQPRLQVGDMFEIDAL